MLSLILATDQKGLIGNSGDHFKKWYNLPWYYPGDLRRFRILTTNKIVVMGRKTFDSLGRKPLPNRKNIIISNSLSGISGVEVTNNIKYIQQLSENDAVFIIGGKTIFELFFPLVDRIYLTRIQGIYCGDVFLNLDLEDFHLASNIEMLADDNHYFSYKFQIYVRNKN